MADRLTLSLRNFLAQKADLRAHLGKSANWDTWVFADKPYGKVENTGTSMVVITQDGGWAPPNEHNTMRFPRIFVDVWSDPDRNEDNSIQKRNADDKIIEIQNVISSYIHTVNLNNRGMPWVWGTAEQISTGRGAVIAGSARQQEVSFRDMANNDGGRLGTCVYGVNLL